MSCFGLAVKEIVLPEHLSWQHRTLPPMIGPLVTLLLYIVSLPFYVLRATSHITFSVVYLGCFKRAHENVKCKHRTKRFANMCHTETVLRDSLALVAHRVTF